MDHGTVTLTNTTRATLLLVGLALVVPALAEGALAQGPSRVRLGGGAATGGDILSDWGGHGFVELSANPGGLFDLRGGPSLAVGPFHNRNVHVAIGLDVAALVAFGSATRPYLGLGLGYTHTDASRYRPVAHDMGYTLVVGVEWRRSEGTWFMEVRPRIFGNVFRQGVTRSITFLSVGRSWR